MITQSLPSNRLFAFLALALTTSAVAALTPTEWRHQQTLAIDQPGLVQVELPAATFDSAGAEQQDLRVLDPQGREVAFLFDQPPATAPRPVRPTSFTTKIEPGKTVLTLTTRTEAALRAVQLGTPYPYFIKAARLELSDNQTDWRLIDDGAVLFRQWGAENLKLTFKPQRAAFVRITIDDHRGAVIPFTGAFIELAAAPAPAPIPVDAQIERRDDYAGETVLTLALAARHLPLANLEFVTAEPLFMRRVTVSVRELHDTIPTERTVGWGTIYRLALDGAPSRAQLELPLLFTPDTRQLLVHIHNGDSPPLIIDSVQAHRQPVTLRFMAITAGNYTLLTGNPQVGPPHYDLAAFAEEMRGAEAVRVHPGEVTDTPGYHPRESIATTPLSDIPLTGSALDTADWRRTRTIKIETPGVQELELDASVLAHTQPWLGDLRVMQSGKQIPYVLEHTTLSRAIPLIPVAEPDSKRPAVSVWKLTLPEAGLPLQRIRLTTRTALFQRQLRFFEKRTDANGRSYESDLATGAWIRRPESGALPTRTFDLSARPQTDTVWIEADNGDNPAIALDDAQGIYPIARLIFKADERSGFTLAYDHPSIAAPLYDLSLVAPKLLTAKRHLARLGNDERTESRHNLFAAINGGTLFWIVLALVVVGLLVVVAKLLPKPPGSA